MVNMELSGMKKGRRQQRSFKDVVKEDVQRFGVKEGWAEMEPDYLLW